MVMTISAQLSVSATLYYLGNIAVHLGILLLR